MRIGLHRVSDLGDELERAQRRIARLAHDLFERRGASVGRALEDWLSAEDAVFWRPPGEVCEADGCVVVKLARAGVEAKKLIVEIAPEELIVKAPAVHHEHRPGEVLHLCEFRCGELFRAIKLPKPTGPDRATAEYKNGLLRVTAPIAEPARTRSIPIASA